MTQLSVNVNKIATLRNSREKNLPDVAVFSKKILSYGVHGLTVHPRPDGRHIRWPDVTALQNVLALHNRSGHRAEFNVEGFPSPDFIARMKQIKPDQCTLVPDPPEALTSNAGWDLLKNEVALVQIIKALRPSGARISLFVDPATFDKGQELALSRIKPDLIELYTEAYADHFSLPDRDTVTERYCEVALRAQSLHIGVNAGHDLNQKNLGFLIAKIPFLAEVSIGHALICEALEEGMETTIHKYLQLLGPS
jgi:pyridoxine 5-phosphate synthase